MRVKVNTDAIGVYLVLYLIVVGAITAVVSRPTSQELHHHIGTRPLMDWIGWLIALAGPPAVLAAGMLLYLAVKFPPLKIELTKKPSRFAGRITK